MVERSVLNPDVLGSNLCTCSKRSTFKCFHTDERQVNKNKHSWIKIAQNVHYSAVFNIIYLLGENNYFQLICFVLFCFITWFPSFWVLAIYFFQQTSKIWFGPKWFIENIDLPTVYTNGEKIISSSNKRTSFALLKKANK